MNRDFLREDVLVGEFDSASIFTLLSFARSCPDLYRPTAEARLPEPLVLVTGMRALLSGSFGSNLAA